MGPSLRITGRPVDALLERRRVAWSRGLFGMGQPVGKIGEQGFGDSGAVSDDEDAGVRAFFQVPIRRNGKQDAGVDVAGDDDVALAGGADIGFKENG